MTMFVNMEEGNQDVNSANNGQSIDFSVDSEADIGIEIL